jgi:putative ABC transport system permease protein
MGPTFSPTLLTRIHTVAGIASIDTIRAYSLPFRGRLTTLAGTEMAALIARPRLRMLVGDVRRSAAALEAGRAVLISEPFATRFGVSVGDSLALPTAHGLLSVTIAGIYNDYSSDSGIILLDRAASARAFNDNGVDSVAIYVKPGTNIEQVRQALTRAAAPARVDLESTSELRRVVIEIFDRTFAITYALYIIAIVIAVLGVISTLFALVLERRREIGILRYLGLETAGVRMMVLYEAAGIGALGGALGILVGMALSLDLIYVINRQSFGWLIELTTPYAFLVSAFFAVLVVATLAGIVPANIAARIRTAEALREE